MFHKLVGLTLFGEEGYETYRNKIAPILESHRGRFHYDFEVNSVFKSESEKTINRVFILAFPDQHASARFFDDDRYRRIADEYIVPLETTLH